jgi:hypothetical protein
MVVRTNIICGGVDARVPGAVLMEFIWRRSRTLGVIILLLTAAGIAMAVARPHAFINPGLGAEWQCSRTLFVVTCSR